jgi:hypothetical protein
MDFFTMIVLIAVIGSLSKIYRHRIAASADESKETIDYLKKHIERLENRMANVETIVIEEEIEKRFAEL